MATICQNGEMDEWIAFSESFSVFYFPKKKVLYAGVDVSDSTHMVL